MPANTIEPAATGEVCCKELFDRAAVDHWEDVWGVTCGHPATVAWTFDGVRMCFCDRHWKRVNDEQRGDRQ